MDRTTVDALKALGKALCGDSFEVTPGLTDAEMIFEIAKQYEAPEGGGSSVVIDCTDEDNLPTLETGLTEDYFLNNVFIKYTHEGGTNLITSRIVSTILDVETSGDDPSVEIPVISLVVSDVDEDAAHLYLEDRGFVYYPETGEIILDD